MGHCFIFVKKHSELMERAGGNVIELLGSEGYRMERHLKLNYIMRRRDSLRG
jgi:hypothetical protein